MAGGGAGGTARGGEMLRITGVCCAPSGEEMSSFVGER